MTITSTPLPAIADEASDAARYFDGVGIAAPAAFLVWFGDNARQGGTVTAWALGKASDLIALAQAVGANQAIAEGVPALLA